MRPIFVTKCFSFKNFSHNLCDYVENKFLDSAGLHNNNHFFLLKQGPSQVYVPASQPFPLQNEEDDRSFFL